MVAASDTALQHAPHTPRPLPLFLDIARRVVGDDDVLMACVLAGLRRYENAPRAVRSQQPVLSLGPMRAWFAGDRGPWVVLVPSLINPAWIMDLDAERSFMRWLAAQGFRVALIDWESSIQAAPDNRDLAAHVTDLLLPAISALGEPAHVVGYCLGGILAAGAATHCAPRSLTMIATPWDFDKYPPEARAALQGLWAANSQIINTLGMLPMEVLQSVFWHLDPQRTVHKFAAIADAADTDPVLAAFVRLEDWANGGSALSAAAGYDLFERLFANNELATGQWRVGDVKVQPQLLKCPSWQFTATQDRIAPASSACTDIAATPCPSGHVGMMVGRGAESGCWVPLAKWLHSVS